MKKENIMKKKLKELWQLIYEYIFWFLVSVIMFPFTAYIYDSISTNQYKAIIKTPHIKELRETLSGPWFIVICELLIFVGIFIYCFSFSRGKKDLKKLFGLFFIGIILYFFLGTLSIATSDQKFMNNFIICYIVLFPIVIIYFKKFIHSLFTSLMNFLTNSNESEIYPERVTVIWQTIAGIAIAMWTIFKFFD